MNLKFILPLLLSLAFFSNANELKLDIKRFEVRNKNSDIGNIKKSLSSIGNDFDSIEIVKIENSGLYGLLQNDNISFYITSDGKHIIKGNILKIENGKIQSRKNKAESEIFFLIDKNDGIYYKSEDEKNIIYVFVDYSCPFCYKFHKKTLNALLQEGISVVYLPILKNHLNKNVKLNTTNIFCLKDKNLAKKILNQAFESKGKYEYKNISCNSPVHVEKILFLTNLLDIDGTPAVFTKNGRYIGGYDEALDIINKL